VIASVLILAGGSGTRFWPASRRGRPKQLLLLDGERSLLQETVDRLAPLVPLDRIWISTTAALVDAIREQLPNLDANRILVEPVGRNTAPAILGAVARLPAEARARAIAVLPSDHRIADAVAFRSALGAAFSVAESEDRIVALGVVPRWAETGFGYLELGAELAGGRGLREVVRFREKPDLETAERFVRSGRHVWNAGMFVFRGDHLLAEARRHAPELSRGVERWAADPGREDLWAALPSISIDYAVMEKVDRLATLPLDSGWDDLGSWNALYELLSGDADGNRLRGRAVTVEAHDNLVFAEQGLVALVGVRDLVVVRSGDAVLVMPRDRAQEVRRVVERLIADGETELV